MISLNDICMKPLDQDCATQSVLQVKLVVCIWVVHIIECSDGTCKTSFILFLFFFSWYAINMSALCAFLGGFKGTLIWVNWRRDTVINSLCFFYAYIYVQRTNQEAYYIFIFLLFSWACGFSGNILCRTWIDNGKS